MVCICAEACLIHNNYHPDSLWKRSHYSNLLHGCYTSSSSSSLCRWRRMLWPLINRRSGLLIKRIDAVEVENMTHFHALCIKRPLLWAEAYSTLEAFSKPQQIAPNVFSEDALATITFTFIWWFGSLENKPQHCQPHKTST